MHELITDQSFDLNRTKEYKLSIQVSLDGFSFSIIRANDLRVIGLKTIPAKISTEKFIGRRFREWVQSEETFNHPFSEIQVQYNTGNFTVLPGTFYNEEKQNELAAMLFEQEVTSQVFADIVDDEIQILFTLPVELATEISSKFENCKIIHPVASLLKKRPQNLKENENGVLLYFSKNSFILLLFHVNILLLANRFEFNHANDAVYFLMAVLNQHKVKPTDANIYFSGEIVKNSEVEKLLREYFDKAEFWHPSNPMNTEIFKNDLHRFISLL